MLKKRIRVSLSFFIDVPADSKIDQIARYARTQLYLKSLETIPLTYEEVATFEVEHAPNYKD